MARIRTIKPAHWADKELSKISLQAHLLWIATWTFSDDEGVFEGDALLIKSQIFPRRTDIRTEQIQSWLDQLVKARFVIPFAYNGDGYYLHRTFKAHQRIDKPQASQIPDNVIAKVIADHSRPIQERSENDPRMVPPVEESNSSGVEGSGVAQGAEGEPGRRREQQSPQQPPEPKPPVAPPPQKSAIVLPWDGEQFRAAWDHWKEYKWEEFKFKYKGLHSEQAALMELSNKSEGREENALEIIQHSMANGWKGLIKPRKDDNTNSKDQQQFGGPNADHKRKLAERAAALAGNGGFGAR